MKKQEDWKRLEEGLLAAMQEGTQNVPYLFLKLYPSLQLTDSEAMLIIQLMAFLDKEKMEFPTIDQIQSRLAAPPEHVIKMLQKLLKDNWITIDEQIDLVSGIQSERYNLKGVYQKMAAAWVERQKQEAAREKQSAAADSAKDIFTIFEKEFGRPLTPMELETIAGWIDQDNYKQELILAALKEAVFAGKVHFRYIDRILLEWSRNRVHSVEQAKEHAQRFRSGR